MEVAGLRIIEFVLRLWYCATYKFRKSKISIVKATLSDDGSFIDIRYWLSRPDKADGRLSILLTDAKTGDRFKLMRLTKFGVIQTKHNKYQHMGVLLFYNMGNKIKPGSKVHLFYSPFNVKNIEVS
jgi:hypothetical protein